MNGADIGVVELGGRSRLPHKSSQRMLILGEMFRNKFQCNMTAKAEILSLINHSHPAHAQLRQHAVMGYRLPNDFHGFMWGGHSCPPPFAFDSTGGAEGKALLPVKAQW
jgi:hypothetical protein